MRSLSIETGLALACVLVAGMAKMGLNCRQKLATFRWLPFRRQFEGNIQACGVATKRMNKKNDLKILKHHLHLVVTCSLEMIADCLMYLCTCGLIINESDNNIEPIISFLFALEIKKKDKMKHKLCLYDYLKK